MNSIQKQFYRHHYEQKIPKILHHDLQKVTINTVINSKVVDKSMFTSGFGVAYCVNKVRVSPIGRFNTVDQLIHRAFYKMKRSELRLCFNKYLTRTLELYKEGKLYTRYNSLEHELKYYKDWYNKLNEK